VVIAIIGILISLVMPSLGRVRDSARATACMSNLRQAGVAVMLYAADNKGRLVPANGSHQTASWRPAGATNKRYAYAGILDPYLGCEGFGSLASGSGMGPGRKNLRCPSASAYPFGVELWTCYGENFSNDHGNPRAPFVFSYPAGETYFYKQISTLSPSVFLFADSDLNSIFNIDDGPFNGPYGQWRVDLDGDGVLDMPLTWMDVRYFLGGFALRHGVPDDWRQGYANALLPDGNLRKADKEFILRRDRNFWSAIGP